MIVILRTALLVSMTLGTVWAVEAALPEFMEIFHADPLRRSDLAGCNTCHVDETGVGERNEFGRAFEANQSTITPELRSQFPDRFVIQTASAGVAEVQFADTDGTSMVLEIGGERFLIDVAARSVTKLDLIDVPSEPVAVTFEPIAFNSEPMAVVSQPMESPSPEPQAAIPGDAAAREGAVFGSRVVNLPNAKAVPEGGVEFLIGHRFVQPLFESDSPADLFGFDSPAQVTFGVDVGVKDWLSLSAARSNDPGSPGGTIELNSAVQFSSQGDTAPVSTQLRVGIDGRDNFTEQYAPYLQFVASRTFWDRLSFVLAPGVAFNTRNDSSSVPPDQMFGAEHDYTASLGVGASLRVLPTVSIVGEYVPRLSGFRGEFSDRPSVSFGVQKSTFRHTFEFVISNTFPMMTSQYTVNGTPKFKVGFNIYRRLR